MESSRIFIKGLPPTISEEEFRKHFSSKQAITDAKLIPHRRIGYVGYKTPEDAQKAVKYFNKSFIRMSKIGVEMARAVRLHLKSPLKRFFFTDIFHNRSLTQLYPRQGRYRERPRDRPSRSDKSALLQKRLPSPTSPP